VSAAFQCVALTSYLFSERLDIAAALECWAARKRSPATLLVGEGSGEIAALVAADALSAGDAIWLAAERGRLMSETTTRLGLAALALRDIGLRTGRQLAAAHELTIASDNAPEEVILAGRRTLINAAAGTARRLGVEAAPVPAVRAIPSPEFASVRREWRIALESVEMRLPRPAVFSCTALHMVIDPRTTLAESLTASIRFRQARSVLERLGVRRLISIAAGDGFDRTDVLLKM
jgi:acyl transferase domain-containing protein